MKRQLLIERISSIEIPRNKLIESIDRNDGRLIIQNVLLQRADTPNKNRRVYPKSILERELNVYFEKITDKKAFCELDHPSCFSQNTEILTKDGWKFISDIIVGELVMTLNPETNLMEWQPVNSVVNESYTGKMVHIKGNNIDTLVTPNHRFYLKDQYEKFYVKTASDIVDLSLSEKTNKFKIPIVANWKGVDYETWTIPAQTDYMGSNVRKEIQSTDLVVNADTFFAFLGFYLAEGCVDNTENRGNYGIHICQNEGERAEQFRQILQDLSPELIWKERVKPNGKQIDFFTHDFRLYSYLKPLGNKYTKFIPDDIKDASPRLLKILFDWYLKGDGASVDYKGYNRKSVFTVSKLLIEDLHEVLIKTGMTGVIKIQPNHLKDRTIEGRLIKKENSNPLYRLWVKKSKAIHLDFRFLNVSEEDYDGTIHCVSVNNKTIYCRDGIAPFWSGNSEPDCNVVTLKNVCQAIKDAYWKGNELRGDVEVLNTPSGNIVKEILLAGYRVGQSSRGLGSVQSLREGDEDDLMEVQDDFSLITLADCVSDESTHNANMIMSEGYETKPLKESKMNSLIRDILCELGNGSQCCYK